MTLGCGYLSYWKNMLLDTEHRRCFLTYFFHNNNNWEGDKKIRLCLSNLSNAQIITNLCVVDDKLFYICYLFKLKKPITNVKLLKQNIHRISYLWINMNYFMKPFKFKYLIFMLLNCYKTKYYLGIFILTSFFEHNSFFASEMDWTV